MKSPLRFVAPLVIVASLLLRGLWGYHAGKLWRLGIQFGVENFLGIRPQVVGLENMPQEPCVILSKHQSAWETMTLQDYVPKGAYCVFVLKKGGRLLKNNNFFIFMAARILIRFQIGHSLV